MTTVELIMTAVGVVGGGSVTAGVRLFRSRFKARSNERIADTIHDERVSPGLLARIKSLEERLDERDLKVDELQDKLAKVERDRDDCERKHEELSEKLERQADELTALRADYEQLQQALRDTPAGAWRLDKRSGTG